MLAYALSRRRIEPVGATAIAVFAIALLLTIALEAARFRSNFTVQSFPARLGLLA